MNPPEVVSVWEVGVAVVAKSSAVRKLKPLAVRFVSMGSPCEVRLISKNKEQATKVLKLAVQEVNRLNDKYSRYKADSVISRINQSAGSDRLLTLDEETSAILNYADVCFHESDGLFDITSGVLRKAWNFKTGNITTKAPSQTLLDELLDLVGWQKVYRQGQQFALPQKNMEIDFGGIVKEYAADAVASLCQQQGIYSGLVDLGGDIRIIGPYPDDDYWSIHIQNPQKTGASLRELQVKQGGIATSGVYERFIELDGKRYSHLLNPKTGWPVEDCPISLTVLAPQCIIAGSITTMAMLKGKECANWLQESIELPYWCYLSNGELLTNSK